MTSLNINSMELFVSELWRKIERKVNVTSERLKDTMPYTTEDGRYDDRQDVFVWWTNSFWAGILWHMFRETGADKYRIYAESIEAKLDKFLYDYDGVDHDAGFLWLLSSVLSYETTGNDKSRKRALLAASVLAARSMPNGGYIRAWNGAVNNGQSIIDCMMNIPLLYWASKQLQDDRFRRIADLHAQATLTHLIREDGSVHHIVAFDEQTGAVKAYPPGQGFASGSSWSRGQSWALYGFAQSYHWTGRDEYLSAAKRVAHYILANLALNDYVPLCDYRQPSDSDMLDSSAGAIAACGLIELADCVPEAESRLYLESALRIMQALDERCGVWDDSSEALLTNGSCRFYASEMIGGVKNGSLIYGDYYWIEAVCKLKARL